MQKTLILVLVLVVGIVMGALRHQVLNAQQQEPIKRTVLMKTDLEGLEGQEAYMVMVEFAPGARSGKHYHPGPVIVYTLSGSGTWEAEGMPSKALVHHC